MEFINNNNNNNSDYIIVEDQLNSDDLLSLDEYFNSFPPGFRFCPTDEELIVEYLKRKLKNLPLPPNRISEIFLQQYNPEQLREQYKKYGENEWYFFTPTFRKYKNGDRPNRAAGDGYWKATGADKLIQSKGGSGGVIGVKKSLVYHRGKPPRGEKTHWIMYEYRIPNASTCTRKGTDDMKLDDWVLCRIYENVQESNSSRALKNEHEVPLLPENMQFSVKAEELMQTSFASNEELMQPKAEEVMQPDFHVKPDELMQPRFASNEELMQPKAEDVMQPDFHVKPDELMQPVMQPDFHVKPDELMQPHAYVKPAELIQPLAYVKPDDFMQPDFHVKSDELMQPPHFDVKPNFVYNNNWEDEVPYMEPYDKLYEHDPLIDQEFNSWFNL